MNTEQENFDDILRSKLSEGEFEFNEANWDKAEALIIQADKKRKRRRIGFIFFIGLILGVCLMIPFVGGKKESLRSKNKETVAEKKGVSIENSTKTENRKTGKELVAQQESNDAANHNTKENKQADILQTNENALKEEITVNSQKEEKSLGNKPSQKNISTNISPSSVKKEANTINIKSSQSNTTNDALVSNHGITKTSKTEKQKGRSGAENLNNTISNAKENGTLPNKEITNIISKQDQATINSTESKTTDTTNTSTSTNKSIAKETTITIKDSVATTKTDSTKPVAKETKQEAKKEELKQATIFSIDAGANYVLGWKYNTTKEAAGFNAVLGVSVIHYFNIKWSILAGLQYNSLAHLGYSSYTGSNTQFGFGYSTSYTTITPKTIYYMAIPLKLQYWINNKNSISIGANVLFLLNTLSKVDTYTQTDFTNSNHTTNTKLGYMDGLSILDIQPAITYRRRVYKNFSLSAEAYYGLIDIKSNSFFGINKSEKNSGFRLVLSYSFVK